MLTEDSPLQYKIKGPKILRFISRVNVKDVILNSGYNFILREDGRFISNYAYEISESDANALVNDSDISLSGYKSSFYNVPSGIHYYTFLNNKNDSIYLKLEEYENN